MISEQGKRWQIQERSRLQALYLRDFADWLDDAHVHPCNIELAYHAHEILEGMCISALDNIRVDLPLNPEDCDNILARMRRELPKCPDLGAGP